MFLQTSDVREKELADDVSVRNLILSVYEVLKNCPYLYFLSLLQMSDDKTKDAASNGNVSKHCSTIY